MLKYLWALVLIATLAFVGCRTLDYAFTPHPRTGISPAMDVGRAAQPYVPSPWGEAGLGALLLLQNGYLLTRKIQNRKKA